jgi:anti-anti-sigma factor
MVAGGARRQDLLTVRLLGDSRSRVIWLEGEVDVSTVAVLAEALDVAIADHPEVLLIDLRNLSFLDSRGLRSLLDAQEACHAIDCRLLLMRGSRPVERLIQIAAVDGLFEFVSGLSEVASSAEPNTHGGDVFVQGTRVFAKT